MKRQNYKLQTTNYKLVVILGPTASGKTSLSIKLAQKFGGEIVSADSRQVYKGLDIGSGKVNKKEMQGIAHYLLDVANPKNRFSVTQYQKLAQKAIKNIQTKGKLPFLVGGTGFYIQSIVDNIVLPEIKPNWKLRARLEKKSNEELFLMLQKLDPVRAQNIDRHNPRRLLRALEIVMTTGRPVPALTCHCEEPAGDVAIQDISTNSRLLRFARNDGLDVLQIGIKKDKTELANLIKKRLLARLKNNAMINEVKKLHNPPAGKGLSWKRLEELGLEYKFVAQYLQNKISYQEMINKIQIESEHFAKRQATWFKRDKRIIWVSNYKQGEKLVKKFSNK
jgi:tRNA dimethylallyltransferase